MRLLVFTQKVDKQDDVLGFFHGWLQEFSKKFESIIAVCLWKGEHTLPKNIEVHSLGKESVSQSGDIFTQMRIRIMYMVRFFILIFSQRRQYDAVFVHMNPIYVVLGFPLWKILRRPVYLWYNHHQADGIGKIAFRLATKIFHTSPFAYSARYPQSQKMPAGIDTAVFFPTNQPRKKNSILYVGRISPIKSVETLLEAAQILSQKGIDFTLSLVGKADPEAGEYYQKLQLMSAELQKQGRVEFLGAIPNKDMAALYHRHEILVNLSPAGLYDKTVPEAMACESLVLASSPAFTDVIGNQFLFREKDAQSLADKIQECFAFSEVEKQNRGKVFRSFVEEHESLRLLSDRLVSFLEK